MKVQVIKCPECGATISPGENFCEYCGTHMVIEEDVPQMSLNEKTGYEFERGRIKAQQEAKDKAYKENLDRRINAYQKKIAYEKQKLDEELKEKERRDTEYKEMTHKRFLLSILMSAVDLGLIVISLQNHISTWYALIPLLLMIATQLFAGGDRTWNRITVILEIIALICCWVEMRMTREPFAVQVIRLVAVAIMLVVNFTWRKRIRKK